MDTREIKFEFIWEHEGKHLKKVYTLCDIEKGEVSPTYNESNFFLKCWKRIAVRQFTGFKDLEGSEVYEGDIVVSRDMRPSLVLYSPQGYFHFDEWVVSDYLNMHGVNFKVIGNIFENEGLLDYHA